MYSAPVDEPGASGFSVVIVSSAVGLGDPESGGLVWTAVSTRETNALN